MLGLSNCRCKLRHTVLVISGAAACGYTALPELGVGRDAGVDSAIDTTLVHQAALAAIEGCDAGDIGQCQSGFDNNWSRSRKQIRDAYVAIGATLPTEPHSYRVTFTYADPNASPAMWTQTPRSNLPLTLTTCGNMTNATIYPVTATWSY